MKVTDIWTAGILVLACMTSCESDDPVSPTGSDAGTGGGMDSVCEPGETRKCDGPGQCDGAQACKDSGAGWTECDCGDGGDGAGGTTGGAGAEGGSGGDAGSGAGGSSGSGAGGSSGDGGAGGDAGSAGTGTGGEGASGGDGGGSGDGGSGGVGGGGDGGGAGTSGSGGSGGGGGSDPEGPILDAAGPGSNVETEGPGGTTPCTASTTDLGVPWVSQKIAPLTWSANVCCGPAVATMVLGYVNGVVQLGDQDLKNTIDWMDANVSGWNGNSYSCSYTNTNILIPVLQNYAGVQARAMDIGWCDLPGYLDDEHIVIIHVGAQGSNPTQVFLDGASHWVILDQIDGTFTYVNDPGRTSASNGDHRKYTTSSVRASFEAKGTLPGRGLAVVVSLSGDTCGGCSGHGQCVEGSCSCNAGFAGTYCGECAPGYTGYPDCAPACPGGSAYCNNHGTCLNNSCSCTTGYAGDKCGECAPGYTGYPDCVPACPGGSAYCNNHGTCLNNSCSCTTGYAGDKCDECDAGYTGYPNCVQNCPGGSDYCNGHGTCLNNSCSCATGYDGATCNECASDHPGSYPSCCLNGCSAHGSCSGTTCSCVGGWTGSDCSTPPPETCDGIDNDGNGKIDDNNACWRAIYRFQQVSTGARCWGTVAGSPPSACSGYVSEVEAFIVRTNQVAGTFEGRQCSKGTDHIIVDATNTTDVTVLTGAGYDCTLSLGYFYNVGSAPASGQTQWTNTCKLWRFSYSAGGSGAHLFTRGADNTSGMTCEPPARAEVFSNFGCFSGTPTGC